MSSPDAAPPRRGRPRQAAEPAEQKVEAVERALGILEAFADGTPRLTLAELAARTGFYPSTILRLAGSLERFGYLGREADGRFRLGPTPLRLGVLYQESFDLAALVRPALARLVATTGETAAFYVREGERRICLYRQHSPRLLRHHVEEGGALPLDRGASGHVLRAFTEGGAGGEGPWISLGERDPELAALAVPVFGRGRRFLGALGLSGPLGRFQPAERARMAAALAEDAAGLARSLGG